MDDALVLDRLDQPPAVPLLRTSVPRDEFDDLKLAVETAVQNREVWIQNVQIAVAEGRRHPDHIPTFLEAWPEVESRFNEAISNTKRLINKSKPLPNDAPRVRNLKRQIQDQLTDEHNILVQLYYLLKSDADDLADDTQPTGDVLRSDEDIDAFFDGIKKA